VNTIWKGIAMKRALGPGFASIFFAFAWMDSAFGCGCISGEVLLDYQSGQKAVSDRDRELAADFTHRRTVCGTGRRRLVTKLRAFLGRALMRVDPVVALRHE